MGQVLSLAELSTGVAYCQLLADLYPASLERKKIKLIACHELDRVHNWKLFQQALRRLHVAKEVDILQRIRPYSPGNLDFCRWFVSFFEANKNRPQPTQTASSTSTFVISSR